MRGVQVSAPTSISLDTERVKRRSDCDYVLQTTEENVVLRNGENSLCVVDAKMFCAGSMEIRHVVELPQNVTFSRKSSGKYGVAWGNIQKEDATPSSAVYIVDYHTGEVIVRTLPPLDEEIVDAFVDPNGEQLAVVGVATGNVYGWSQCNWDYSEHLGKWNSSEWRLVDALILDTTPVGACSCGRFVSSAVMGNCFVYLRARRHSIESVVVEKWTFDVDAHWTPVSYSSRTLGDSTSKPTEELALFMTENWQFAIMTTGSALYHIQADQDLRNSSIKGLSLDQKVLDGAWINHNTAFAMLLANGQISIVSVSYSRRFELLGITTSTTMSKRLSLSALLGKAVSVARQLVWVDHDAQVIVDFETSCAAFKLDIVDEESSSNPANHSNKSTELFLTDPFAQHNRWVMTRLHAKTPDFGDNIREILDEKPSPSSNRLIVAARISLTRSQTVFEDMYFMLICIIHQQLAGDSVSKGNSRDPIECIGNSLKLMEVLVSFTISMEATILRQISSRIISTLPGCTTKSDRKIYYGKEIIAISQQLRKLLRGIRESEDWWVYSREATAFLRVYFTTARTLLQEISTSTKLKPGEATQIYSLCQRIFEQGDGATVVESIASSERMIDRLTGLLASYTYICCSLRVNGVMIDLEHYYSLVTTNISTRQERLCCFLNPWIRLIDNPRPGISEKRMAQAVRFSIKSNTLQLLLNFSIVSNSRIVHSCVQALCNAAEICTRKNDIETSVGVLQVDSLHWQACELYIGEAMAILHRIGPCRQFKYSNREAEDNTGVISHAIRDGFDYYLRTLSAELWKTPGNSRVASNTSSQREFSHLDERLRARVICLLSRIVWHLEVTSKDCISPVQRAFVLNMFDSQLDTLSEEHEALHECITKVRAIINSEETEIRLLRCRQPQDAQPGFSVRTQKIARSMVLIAWALWLREKAAICSRSMHIGKLRDDCGEIEILGAQVATCALSLDALGMVCGDNEGLLSIQLTLLKDASIMNPRKAAEVIAWGFSARKILTRYLKRYKGLRLAVQRSCMGISLEENELQCQQLQNRIRQEFYHFQESLLNEELNHDDNRDIDVLMACCCYPEFLQIISVLTKCPCEVVTVTHSAPPCEIKTFVQEPPENVHDNIKIGLTTRADPEIVAVSNGEQHVEAPKSENVISRDEVMALLEEQTRHLEEKIHAVTAAGQPRPSCSHEDDQKLQTEETLPFSDREKHIAASEILPEKVDANEETGVNLTDVQRMARISLQVRDLGRHVYSSADKQANPLSKPVQRHDSVRNALKLFRLRQENGGHTRSEPGDLATDNENGTPNIEGNLKAASDAQGPAAVLSRRDKLKRSDVNQKSSRNLHGIPPKEPVYPLRLEYGIDNASLKLLGRSPQQRNPSVKRKQFVHQERGRLHKVNAAKPRAIDSNVEPTEVILLKTSSAQTNGSIETGIPPISATKGTKELMNTQNEIGPEKESPVTQERDGGKQVSHSSVAVNTHNLQKGVGIQRHVADDGPANVVRKKRGQTYLSIADKYPIWVDLDSANNGGARHFKERKKFLQVARFGGPDTTDRTTNNDANEDSELVTISPSVSSTREGNLEDESDENQSDSPRFRHRESQEDQSTEQKDNEMKERYRARYRENYPVRERLSSRKSDDRDAVGGITSLMDLRDNMQRMTQRLQVLETCANSIDEEFKVSQKRLTQIGDVRLDHASSQSKVLEDIDQVLEMTKEADSEEGGRNSREGLLSKKASRDLGAAKYDLSFSNDNLSSPTDQNLLENVNRKLLETIEHLAISTDDQ